MRKDSINGEYPIITSHSGILSYDDYKFVANSFEEVCRGIETIDSLE